MTMPTQRPPGPPPRYKVAFVTWLGLYPVLTALIFMMRPLIGELPMPMQTLLLTAIVVPMMTWFIAPIMQRLFAGWLGKG